MRATLINFAAILKQFPTKVTTFFYSPEGFSFTPGMKGILKGNTVMYRIILLDEIDRLSWRNPYRFLIE